MFYERWRGWAIQVQIFNHLLYHINQGLAVMLFLLRDLLGLLSLILTWCHSPLFQLAFILGSKLRGKLVFAITLLKLIFLQIPCLGIFVYSSIIFFEGVVTIAWGGFERYLQVAPQVHGLLLVGNRGCPIIDGLALWVFFDGGLWTPDWSVTWMLQI